MIYAEILITTPADPRPVRALSQTDKKGSSDTAGPGKLSVMVVEDEWIVSMEIEAALEEGGYDCVGVASTAREALALAGSARPDLVLMDIRLKGNDDGVEVAKELRNRFGLRCLFISAHADGATKERAAGADPLGWLPKPFSAPQLLQMLAAVNSELGQK
ncbi:MAG: response regulator [Pseudomonadota bacterium]|jgi:two-component system, response regulator PdtaR|nr:response regulator [Pseudomonadota bacterium]